MTKRSSLARKILVGVGGSLTIVIGLLLLPTPAPEGWLIIFGGIALMSSEFSFAKRLLNQAKAVRRNWNHWMKRQPPAFQLAFNVVMVLLIVTGLTLMGVVIVNMFV